MFRSAVLAACLAFVPVPAVLAQAADAEVQAAVERTERLQAELDRLQTESASRADDPTFFFALGNVYADLSRREDAIAAYQSAVDIKSDYVEALVNLGALQNEIGETDLAIQTLTRAADLRPDDSKVLVNLGNCYYSKGDYYTAVTQFRKAIEVDPDSYEAHYQMGVAYADAGIYREAIREWRRVVELSGGSDAAKSAQANIDVVEKILARRL